MSERGTPPTDPKLVAALRNYLPSSLERQCLLGDEIRNPSACVQHLTALLRTVSTYLPHQVVVPLLADPQPGRVEGRFTYGTVMFADISGFTAMSEKLSKLGKKGAEEVTGIINHLFTALLEATRSGRLRWKMYDDVATATLPSSSLTRARLLRDGEVRLAGRPSLRLDILDDEGNVLADPYEYGMAHIPGELLQVLTGRSNDLVRRMNEAIAEWEEVESGADR